MNDRELIEHWKSQYYATGDDIYRIHKWCRLIQRAMVDKEVERQNRYRETYRMKERER